MLNHKYVRTENRNVTQEDARPGGAPDRCFYCGVLVGNLHHPFCVIVSEFPVTVRITDTKTGNTADYKTTEYESGDGWDPFIWSDGNYSCDCNRSLFFSRATGTEEEESPACGTIEENRYRVDSIIEDATGDVLYSEEPDAHI
jgi:hypothetical protein